MAKVHLFCQSKGGVGKSFAATMFSQYMRTLNPQIRLLDTDPSNLSLASFKTLQADNLDLRDRNGKITPGSFITLYENITVDKSDCIIDTGASTFIQFKEFFQDADQTIIEDLKEQGFDVIFHMPVTPDQARVFCIRTIEECTKIFSAAKIVIWENNYPDYVITEIEKATNKTILDFFTDKDAAEKITAIVHLPYIDPDLKMVILKEMLTQNLTFEDVINNPDNLRFTGKITRSIGKKYIAYIRKEIFAQIESALRELLNETHIIIH